MKTSKTVWAGAVAAAVLWSLPAFAGPKGLHMGALKHGKSTKTSTMSSESETGETGEASLTTRSNKGGALRGLSRANAVAGEHGEAGRTNAAATFGHTKSK